MDISTEPEPTVIIRMNLTEWHILKGIAGVADPTQAARSAHWNHGAKTEPTTYEVAAVTDQICHRTLGIL